MMMMMMMMMMQTNAYTLNVPGLEIWSQNKRYKHAFSSCDLKMTLINGCDLHIPRPRPSKFTASQVDASEKITAPQSRLVKMLFSVGGVPGPPRPP